MALTAKSLFLYGLKVDQYNSSIDFKNASGGSMLMATVRFGYYSLTGLADAIESALNNADVTNIYTVTINRNVAGGLENRLTITSDGTWFELFFASGPRVASSISDLIGFNVSDYTGALFYTGNASCGTVLIPSMVGYSFKSPEQVQEVFGAVNVSAVGEKESIVFNIMKFTEVSFMYEPKSRMSEWQSFFQWIILQRGFEFTPEITSPDDFYDVTLEKTGRSGKGLGYEFKEMLPKWPNFYETGALTMRLKVPPSGFIS